MNAAAINSLNQMVNAADQKLENLNAHLQAKSWQNYECEGDHLVRGENELKEEISAAQNELRHLRTSLRMSKIEVSLTPRA